MESHIERIINGEFGYGHSTLEFPEQKLEITVFPNENAEGLFHVLSEDKTPINGMVTASDPRLNCDEVRSENGKAEVHFTFNARGLESGTVIRGDVFLISEEGEYRLPFSVSVIMKYPESSQGKIKNLFHFTNLARNHFEEAVNVFYSPEMINIFQSPDRRFKNLYRAFSVYPGSAVNVEGFLIAIHKKSPVIFTVDLEKVEINGEEELKKTFEIRVRKSGWGYTRLDVKAGESFLCFKNDVLVESDFDGENAVIKYTVDREKLHAGKNLTEIILKSFSSEIKIPVCINISNSFQAERKRYGLKRQGNVSELLKLFLDFRVKELDLEKYCSLTAKTCERMTAENDRDILPRLVMTHIYLMQGREHDASLMLSLINNEFMLGQIKEESEGYYKYLLAMLKKDPVFTREMSADVHSLLSSFPASPGLLWLLIYLDEELGDQAERRLELLNDQFERGVRSPLLYIEMLRALTEKKDKSRFSGMGEIYALNFGLKYSICFESYVSAIVSMSYSIKGYSGVFLNVAKAYYERFRSPELLETVCTILIRERGNRKKRTDDFYWFELGVRSGLKITRLYESYLNTMPENMTKLMPEPVIMYFSIGAGVGNDKMALFYASLIRHKDEIPDILETNEQRITAFAVKEAENGRLSGNHVIIYEYVALINKSDIINRFMLAVSPLIFSREITVSDPDATMVVSVESGFTREHNGRITGGRALLNVYGGDYDLIIEYSDMRRSVAKKGVGDRPLMNPSRFKRAIKFGLERDVGHAFYVCGSGNHSIQVNQVNESSVRLLSGSAEIEKSIRDECNFALIRYYSDNDRFEELDRLIGELDISNSSQSVRAEIARLYVARGMHRNVYELIKEYGFEGVDPVILVRLASRMIGDGINTGDPCLLNLAWEALKRGKYDENILEYLCSEFKGTIKDLRDIWKAAHEFNIDTVKIEERILSQMLYAGSFTADRDEILLSCIENGGRDRIIDASLDYISHEYFVNSNLINKEIFRALLKRYRDNGEMSNISALALLKYYSPETDENLKKELSPLVEELLERGVIFEFFREYREYVPSMALYHDRTFVEYRTEPDKKVMIHYCISDEEGSEENYIDENMNESYQGVYTDDFVLFYGERLQYYITEENEDGRIPTESEELERDVTRGGRTDSRYDMINDMLLSESVHDDPSLDDLMEQYMRLSETVEEFFDK